MGETRPLTIGSLFAGIGGFDLAAEAMGWRTAWFVERDPHCQRWLAEHFPDAPIYGDITQVDFTEVEPVDVLCGGFPCQPSSAAGKRLGTADDRWLWPEFARAIGAIRPRYVVAENVPGLLSVNGGRAFAEVLRDMAALGYDADWDSLSARRYGATMKHNSSDERRSSWLPKRSEAETTGLPMFAEIRTPAPSAPGSETSREAAELVSVDGECLRCLLWFARQALPRTRQELAMAVYPAKRVGDVPGLGPACGRVADLVELKYLAEVGRDGKRSTLAITEAGKRWLARRQAA